MKTISLFFFIALLYTAGTDSSAQTSTKAAGKPKSETLKVWGNCDMCKTRIENAVKSDGATSADWNKNTKILTVTFDPSKTSVDSFSKKLAAVGHDTEKYRADDKAYQALDACCQYERRK
jgi:periplasmic mercuric ion binding protein